ncbi:universal stress protein [Pseudobacillus sp. FSL P4-0506]|uniref:universal stress protein n=1 Tax=unclassified Pseudobacillus TaxID=2619284 RepID=UPI0030FA2D49
MDNNILVYADNAEHALEAVKRVVKCESGPSTATITFLYILPVSDHLQEVFQEGVKLAEKLHDYSEFFQEAGNYLNELQINHKKMVRMGNPSQEIALITQSDCYDLLVIAKTASEESVKLITQKAKCPVFTLKNNHED